MAIDPPEKKLPCQHKQARAIMEPLSILDRSGNFALRMISAVRRRTVGRKLRMRRMRGEQILPEISSDDQKSDRETLQPNPETRPFKEGDLIEVLPWEKIKETLDNDFCYRGLQFMEGMQKFCGLKLRVFRKVRSIFDEKRGRMVKIRGTYLLAGCICDGRGVFDKEGCDKSCFFFWRDIWLRKVEET